MNILIVDDELGLRHTLSLILAGEGYAVRTAADGAEALEQLAREEAQLVLCDVRMPNLDGLGFLDRYKAAGGRALVIVMSAYGDDDAAVEAIRRGAYDYLSKPFRPDQVLLVVRKAIEREQLRLEVTSLQREVAELRAPGGIVGRSAALKHTLQMAERAARHPSTVLVTGESGTGKELVARFIHERSPRAAKPFVAVNCGAIPEALLESELFGHVKGAFTGATHERVGLFEEADGGTLFLDEIGELPAPLQVKLLRALQEGEVRRVGDNQSRAVDVRVVAATARDLEGEVAAGRFRADLYYRVNVVRLHLPPLRERRADVPDLARHFVTVHARRLGVPVHGIAPAAMRQLEEHAWPGNVRELENVIERALVLTDGALVEADALPPQLHGGNGAHAAAHAAAHAGPNGGNGGNGGYGATPSIAGSDLSVKRRSEALERELIRAALERTAGNRTRAAKLLELSHRALLYKIREYGLGD